MSSKKSIFQVLPDKENIRTVTKGTRTIRKKLLTQTEARNPLSSLSDNRIVTQDVRPLHKSSNVVEELVVNRKTLEALRSKSTSKAEKKNISTSDYKVKVKKSCDLTEDVKVNYKKLNTCKNITFARNDGSDDDDVFVPGDQHFITWASCTKEETNIVHNKANRNKILQTLPVVRNSGEPSKPDSKPAKKHTLIKKLFNRHKRSIPVEEFYKNCLYPEEYITDNYLSMLSKEGRFSLRLSLLKENINPETRMQVVHWLIYLHQIFNLSEDIFFMTVRLFDWILIQKEGNYELIALNCLWLTNKFSGTRLIMASKLCALSNQKFSKNQILTSEKEILEMLHFDFKVVDIMTYVHYYLKMENLGSDIDIHYAAIFLLELLAFSLEFSSAAPSMLAAVVVYLALIKFNKNYNLLFRFISRNLMDIELFKKYAEHINCVINFYLVPSKVIEILIEKYSTAEKKNILQLFIESTQ